MPENKKDGRIAIEIEIQEDILFTIMCIAHERDITLNQLVNETLKDYIKRELDERKSRAKARKTKSSD
jgi:hypothetical protein